MKHSDVIAHFNSIAQQYDTYKRQKPYYYRAILTELRKHVRYDTPIFDFGCGTGTILSELGCVQSVGYDPSEKMIKIATQKFSKKNTLKFTSTLSRVHAKFSQVIMVDVIEHLASLQKTFKQVATRMKPKGVLIISYVEPQYEPILMLMETLKLKMPEGPHHRVTLEEIIEKSREEFHFVKKITVPLFPFLPYHPITMLLLQKK